jgi:diguanylate cyclase (GGDEF)-like protein/PAS domain S-box-containing protein
LGEIWLIHDLTDRIKAEEAIREAKHDLEHAQAIARIGSWKHDYLTNRTSWSPEMYRIFGWNPEDSVPFDRMQRCISDEDRTKVEVLFRSAADTATAVACEYKIHREDGDFRVLSTIAEAADGSQILCATTMDITERYQMEEAIRRQMEQVHRYSAELEDQRAELIQLNQKLEQLAITDGLTGLYNHRAFQGMLREAQSAGLVSLILLDVDHFKKFNDTHGHPAGDAVLRQVARILESTARQGDYVARYGGEEFVVILPGTNAEMATVAAERFRRAIEVDRETGFSVTASFGVATAEEGTPTVDLVTLADTALYQAKGSGRNRVLHFGQLLDVA